MNPVDNESSEEQRAEAFRVEALEHLHRQTQALESMRGIMLFFTALFVIGAVVWIVQTLRGA